MEKSSLVEMVVYAASCTTLLRAISIRQMKPFAIICGTLEQGDRLVEQMKIFSDNRKILWKDFEKAQEKWLNSRKDDLLFLQSPQKNNREGWVDELSECLSNGFIGEMPIPSIICVLFVGYIPESLADLFSITIPLNETEQFLESGFQGVNIRNILEGEKGKLLYLLKTIADRIYKKYPLKKETDDARILYSAAVIKAVLKDEEERMEELFQAVNEKLEASEEAKDRSDLAELFSMILYENADSLWPIYNRAKTFSEEVAGSNCTLYDEEFYYLPENAMTAILQQMSIWAGPTEVKKNLASAGYLETQGIERGYYTQKLVLSKNCRPRYYKLRRDKIDRVGAAALALVIEMKGEKNNEIGNE
ncbi:MAG TPA: hypothetical protein H9716_06070 [Candidatus Enterocloster faecavium]|uniref:Uncharacterized protein n=1 Tax=Candidatus Enterocloster faecavium TaxID=2838560 RepID=A0A9D2L7J1_9FIRM|nr:hypothetical protein [Candidatus Enterocloster faecavium]